MNVLKTTNRPISEVPLWSFDTEDDGNGKLKQISITDGVRYFHFRDRERFRQWLFVQSRSMAVYATNLEYDLLNTFGDRLDLLDIRFKAAGSVMVSALLRGTKIRFYDTLNHSPMGVKALGEHVGLPKLKMNLASWRYVDRDAEISLRFMERLREGYRALGGGLYATLPASAMDLYRRRFLPFAVRQPSRATLDFLMEGYYGGRVEVFRTDPQCGRIFYVDVNSMYPAVMLRDYPNPNVFRYGRSLDGSYGVADCTVTVSDSYFGSLPFRNGFKLLFPVGTFRGSWTFSEIASAVARGARVERVHRSITFPLSCYPFREYVNALYPLKQNAKTEVERYTAKIALNSLYGKFGEHIEEVKLVPLKGLRTDRPYLVYGPYAFVEAGSFYPNHTNVVWSAYTTAYARETLLTELERIETSGGVPLYCDTDSIIYRAPRALHDDRRELGRWRVEDTYSFAHFLGPKLYSLSGKAGRIVRAKGVPKAHAPEFFDEGRVSFRRPYRLRSILRMGCDTTQWGDFSKRICGVYDKRIVLDNGETRPIPLAESGAIPRRKNRSKGNGKIKG